MRVTQLQLFTSYAYRQKKRKGNEIKKMLGGFFSLASYSLNAAFSLCYCVNGAVISLYRTVRRAQSERVLINRFYYILSFNTLYRVHMGKTYNSDVFNNFVKCFSPSPFYSSTSISIFSQLCLFSI